tara:strand:+ start:1447 stop:1686 length:240 start_codon:yes stop_codon:yes gene_type:complete
MSDEKTPEFYKKFYEDNRVSLLQYASLRKNFSKMVDDVLGKDYYNMAMDVYGCDKECCVHITMKATTFWKQLLNKIKAN